MKHARSKLKNILLVALNSSGVLNFFPYISQNNLTVLNYHRINNPHQAGFDAFKINVSATPLDFEQQMKYVKRHFNVISCQLLAEWLNGKAVLPPRPALITFDDGYYDNYSNAYPVLRALNLPAIIFLATAFIDKDIPFYWDYIAYCFSHTRKNTAELPVIGFCSWVDEASRDETMHRWIEAIKKIPEAEKRTAVDLLGNILEVSIQGNPFKNSHLTWDQAHEMSANGIEFGSHTVNHPILTRVSLDQVKEELINSKKKIEDELGRPVLGFAYPNGGISDFSEEVIKIVNQVGFAIAFTLLPGPASLNQVKKEPLTIRRIYLSHEDDYAHFVFNVSGFAKLLNR